MPVRPDDRTKRWLFRTTNKNLDGKTQRRYGTPGVPGPFMTLTLRGAILYLLPWALAHSEDLTDLQCACEFIDMAIKAYPDLKLLEERNKLQPSEKNSRNKTGRGRPWESTLRRIRYTKV